MICSNGTPLKPGVNKNLSLALSILQGVFTSTSQFFYSASWIDGLTFLVMVLSNRMQFKLPWFWKKATSSGSFSYSPHDFHGRKKWPATKAEPSCSRSRSNFWLLESCTDWPKLKSLQTSFTIFSISSCARRWTNMASEMMGKICQKMVHEWFPNVEWWFLKWWMFQWWQKKMSWMFSISYPDVKNLTKL